MVEKIETIAEKLSGYVTSIKFKSLSKDVIHEAKRRLIDSLGCAFGTFENPPLKKLQKLRIDRYVTVPGQKKTATLWGTATKLPMEYAVEVNTFAVRYLDWNDTYFGTPPGREPAHPSDNIPAIMAVCESERLSGKDLILGIVLAYEIQCRLCDTAGLRLSKWDHVNHIIPASSSACARLMGYPRRRITQAIANSLMQGFQPRINRDADELFTWKGFAAAEASFKAIRGLDLSYALEAPRDIYEGKSGFCETVLKGKSLPLEPSSFGGLAGRFKILEGYIKYHNAEFHAQVPVDLILSHRKSIYDRINKIKEIEFLVAEPTWRIIGQDFRRELPKNKETADHSLHYMVSAALIDGELTHRQYTSNKLKAVKIFSLMQKIKVCEVPEFTASYPEKLSTVLRIKFEDGEGVEAREDYPHGHYKNPLTDSEVEDKFKMLTSNSFTKRQSENILQEIYRLDTLKDITPLVQMMKISNREKPYEAKRGSCLSK